MAVVKVLHHYKIDDPVDAIPIHGVTFYLHQLGLWVSWSVISWYIRHK